MVSHGCHITKLTNGKQVELTITTFSIYDDNLCYFNTSSYKYRWHSVARTSITRCSWSLEMKSLSRFFFLFITKQFYYYSKYSFVFNKMLKWKRVSNFTEDVSSNPDGICKNLSQVLNNMTWNYFLYCSSNWVILHRGYRWGRKRGV